jgi:FkbM family methyltransferase
MYLLRSTRLEIKLLTKNYKMSFDSSIETIILELNETKKIENILHIGACLGEEIYFYQQLEPKKIYWFEPNPKLLKQLNENVTKQNFVSIVFPYAVSNKKGQSQFNIIENETKTNPGCSSLRDLKVHAELYEDIKKMDSCIVETINLDEFLNENNLETEFDLISLDTQGHDYEILTSSDIIFKAKAIVIETAKVELYEGQKIDTEIDDYLESKGYYKKYYHEFHQVWGDSLYLKK